MFYIDFEEFYSSNWWTNATIFYTMSYPPYAKGCAFLDRPPSTAILFWCFLIIFGNFIVFLCACSAVYRFFLVCFSRLLDCSLIIERLGQFWLLIFHISAKKILRKLIMSLHSEKTFLLFLSENSVRRDLLFLIFFSGHKSFLESPIPQIFFQTSVILFY